MFSQTYRMNLVELTLNKQSNSFSVSSELQGIGDSLQLRMFYVRLRSSFNYRLWVYLSIIFHILSPDREQGMISDDFDLSSAL